MTIDPTSEPSCGDAFAYGTMTTIHFLRRRLVVDLPPQPWQERSRTFRPPGFHIGSKPEATSTAKTP